MTKIIVSKERYKTEGLIVEELEGMMRKSIYQHNSDVEFYTEDWDKELRLLGTLRKNGIFEYFAIYFLAKKLFKFLMEDKDANGIKIEKNNA